MWKTDFPWGEQWELVDSSFDVEPRFGHALLAHENNILVFGGRDQMGKFLAMPSLKYDVTSNGWTTLPGSFDGPGPRAFFSSARMSGPLDNVSQWVFFFGGMSSAGLHNDLFVFDIQKSRWLELLPISPPVLAPRSASSLCVATTRQDLDDLSLLAFGGSAEFQKLNDSWANYFRLCSEGSHLLLTETKETRFITDGSDGVALQGGHSFTHPGNQLCSWKVVKSSPSKDLRIQVSMLSLVPGDHLRVYSTPCDSNLPPAFVDPVMEFQTSGQELVTVGCVWVTFSTAPNAISYSYFNITCSQFTPPGPPERSAYLWILLALGILIVLAVLAYFIRRRRRNRNRFAVMLSYSHKDMVFAERLQEGPDRVFCVV